MPCSTAAGATIAPARTGYQLRDRLGSTIAVADRWGHFNGTDSAITSPADGLTRRSYDPFGSPRAAMLNVVTAPHFWGQTLQLDPATRRGFTGHEHLDGTRLIHMNGRAFDYRTGRFLSVDPIVQAPADSQSLNPYSYVFNNPLSGTDPSGYQSCSKTSTKESDVGTECTMMAKDHRSANKLGTMVTVRVGRIRPLITEQNSTKCSSAQIRQHLP
jgi:RHS repeat-associated protein